MLRVGVDFSLQGIACLDASHYRPREIVGQFWAGLGHYRKLGAGAKIVTFNGRGFDLPLLEMARLSLWASGADDPGRTL